MPRGSTSSHLHIIFTKCLTWCHASGAGVADLQAQLAGAEASAQEAADEHTRQVAELHAAAAKSDAELQEHAQRLKEARGELRTAAEHRKGQEEQHTAGSASLPVGLLAGGTR